MMQIVATNVVASRPPERRPTATPTARANFHAFRRGRGVIILRRTKGRIKESSIFVAMKACGTG